MHKDVGSYDAKTKLPELLRRVEEGNTFTITNHGKPIADLVPCINKNRMKAKMAVQNLLRMQKHTVSDKQLKQFREDGRK